MTPNALLFTVLGLLFIVVLYIKFSDVLKEKNAQKKIEQKNDEGQEEVKDFDEDFFKATQAGEPYQLFLSLASQRDCAIIRSLLQADNIPTYCEGEHMNNIYGGIAGTMNAVIAIRLFILEKDYDTAYEIIKDFIEKKIQAADKKTESKIEDTVLKTTGMLLGTPLTSSQEILGITIFPKAEK